MNCSIHSFIHSIYFSHSICTTEGLSLRLATRNLSTLRLDSFAGLRTGIATLSVLAQSLILVEFRNALGIQFGVAVLDIRLQLNICTDTNERKECETATRSQQFHEIVNANTIPSPPPPHCRLDILIYNHAPESWQSYPYQGHWQPTTWSGKPIQHPPPAYGEPCDDSSSRPMTWIDLSLSLQWPDGPVRR